MCYLLLFEIAVVLLNVNELIEHLKLQHKKLREDGSQQLQNSASFDRGKRTERRESEKEKQTDDGMLRCSSYCNITAHKHPSIRCLCI